MDIMCEIKQLYTYMLRKVKKDPAGLHWKIYISFFGFCVLYAKTAIHPGVGGTGGYLPLPCISVNISIVHLHFGE